MDARCSRYHTSFLGTGSNCLTVARIVFPFGSITKAVLVPPRVFSGFLSRFLFKLANPSFMNYLKKAVPGHGHRILGTRSTHPAPRPTSSLRGIYQRYGRRERPMPPAIFSSMSGLQANAALSASSSVNLLPVEDPGGMNYARYLHEVTSRLIASTATIHHSTYHLLRPTFCLQPRDHHHLIINFHLRGHTLFGDSTKAISALQSREKRTLMEHNNRTTVRDFDERLCA